MPYRLFIAGLGPDVCTKSKEDLLTFAPKTIASNAKRVGFLLKPSDPKPEDTTSVSGGAKQDKLENVELLFRDKSRDIISSLILDMTTL